MAARRGEISSCEEGREHRGYGEEYQVVMRGGEHRGYGEEYQVLMRGGGRLSSC